jgi:hypothetical protein
MLADVLLLACLAVPQGPAPVVINELVSDDTTADDREFVELYNRSTQAVDISGWTVRAESNVAVIGTYVVPPSTVLPAGGFWVMGTASVPNVNQVIGTTGLFHDELGAATLRDVQGNIVDTVAYEVNKNLGAVPPLNPSLIEGAGVWGNFRSEDPVPTSLSRMLDGFDTNNNGRDFWLMALTPGTTNNQAPRVPYGNVFDAGTVDTEVLEFVGSFRRPYHVDPTQRSIWNPNAVPASPQGGLAMAVWDIAGGGNSTALVAAPVRDAVFEAYVYFDAALKPSGENETWSIGLQGTTCTFFNTPDPGRTLGFTANGNTGVSLTYQVTSSAATLFLVDHNDGGADWTVLGSVTVQQGVNDGWRRLRLEVSGDRAEAFFGGTPGRGDGARMGGRIATPGIGSLYVGFREAVASLGDHPVRIDALTVRLGAAALETIGTAVATTAGTPQLDARGLPTIGWAGFGLDLQGLVPSSTTFLALGATRLGTPIDLALFGGQAGSFLYVSPDLVVGVPTDAQGKAALNLPIPYDPTLVGRSLFWQDLDPDPALVVPLKLGNSAALRTEFR